MIIIKVIVEKPLFTSNQWVNTINIYEIYIDKLKYRNNRREIKLYGKYNNMDYKILIWFKNDFFISSNRINKFKSKKGISYRLEFNDNENFNIYLRIKHIIPELREIQDNNKYYVINYSKVNKFLGITVSLKISNRDLRNIHPYLEVPRLGKEDRILYKHNKFYYGGSCSPK